MSLPGPGLSPESPVRSGTGSVYYVVRGTSHHSLSIYTGDVDPIWSRIEIEGSSYTFYTPVDGDVGVGSGEEKMYDVDTHKRTNRSSVRSRLRLL